MPRTTRSEPAWRCRGVTVITREGETETDAIARFLARVWEWSMARGKALSPKQVMAELGISRHTFEKLRENDDHFITYRAGKLVRMDEADLEAWKQRQKKAEQAELGKDLGTIA
jgi:predicted DNA-binding transcriptional regulator AlpA